jgi:hypothetical protein
LLFGILEDGSGLKLDCLIWGSCGSGVEGIIVHGTNGSNWEICGWHEYRCKTIEYALSVANNITVSVLYDNNAYILSYLELRSGTWNISNVVILMFFYWEI